MHNFVIIVAGILASLAHQLVKRKDGSNLEYVLGTTLVSSGIVAAVGTYSTMLDAGSLTDYLFTGVGAFAFYGLFGESDVVQGLKAGLIDVVFGSLAKIQSKPKP